jgi:hypothetical protein
MQNVQSLDRGAATDYDYRVFLERIVGAEPLSGWMRRSLKQASVDEEPTIVDTEARVYRLPDGTVGHVGRDSGVGIRDPRDRPVRLEKIGLNTEAVAKQIREVIGDATKRRHIAGHGSILVPSAGWDELGLPRQGLLLAYLVRRLDLTSAPKETSSVLQLVVSDAEGESWRSLGSHEIAGVIRRLRSARPKRTVPQGLNAERIRQRERTMLEELRTSHPGEPVPAVFPVAAIWYEAESH